MKNSSTATKAHLLLLSLLFATALPALAFRDLETGAFISRDPAGFVDGPNLYAYVVDNPWTHFDPEGLATKKEHEQNRTRFTQNRNDLQRRLDKSTALGDKSKKQIGDANNGQNTAINNETKAIAAIEKTAKQINETVQRGIDATRGDSDEAQQLRKQYASKFVSADTLDDASEIFQKFQSNTAMANVIGMAMFLTPTGIDKGAVEVEASLAERILAADRSGSGQKSDILHRAASFLSKEQLEAGASFTLKGGDGVTRELLQTPGGMNGKPGIFEYILDPTKGVTHQRFISGGKITGAPNQAP